MRIFLGLMFFGGLALSMSDSPYFPLPNFVGLLMMIIFVLKQEALDDNS